MTEQELDKFIALIKTTHSRKCGHESATLDISDGIHAFHCRDCGLYAIGDAKAAKALGWTVTPT